MALATQDFTFKGERWRRVTHTPERNFCVGLDLGQSSDPTALAVIDYQKIPLDEYVPNHETKTTTQLCKERYDVRHLERLALGTSYTNIGAYAAELMSRAPLPQFAAELVVDQTGVGRPVVDLLRRSGLSKLVAITITGGDAETRVSHNEYRVPKHLLVTGLDAKLSVGELRFSDKLKEAGAMKSELQDFRRNTSASGYMTYNARSGAHDDLILAVALATYWLAVRKVRGASTSFVRGMF
jgi:hypothetical protein